MNLSFIAPSDHHLRLSRLVSSTTTQGTFFKKTLPAHHGERFEISHPKNEEKKKK